MARDATPGERFAAALARLLPAGDARLGLAVSGGPDSLALLLLASEALPGRIEVATVDHGLRPGSAAEAAAVGALCARRGIAHTTLRPAAPITGSVQASARAARYRLLEEWRVARGLAAVATAHHADDQLETLLMRLGRGAGIGGMSGIRAVNGHVIRPLLDVGKGELLAIVAEAGLAAADDPSNRDPRFDRARLRTALSQAGAAPDRAGFALDPRASVRTAAALAEGEEALGWMADRLAADRLQGVGAAGETGLDTAIRLDPAGLPPEMVRRLLLIACRRLGEPAPRGPSVTRAIAALDGGASVSLGNLLVRSGPRWHICRAPRRRRPSA